MAARTVETLLANVRGVKFTTAPYEVGHHPDATFTRGYIPGRTPHDSSGFYDVGYFAGEKAGIGISFSPDGEFLNPESHYRAKWLDTIAWISEYVSEGNILDVGTGPGHLAYWAERAKPNLRVYGCDVSIPLLTSQYNQNRSKSVSSLAYQLPFQDGAFQGILFSDVLEHVWPHQAVEGIKEAHRVLEDGGYAFIRIPNRNTWTPMAVNDAGHVWLPNISEVRELFSKGGFDPSTIKIMTRGFPSSQLGREIHDVKYPVMGRAILASAKK